VVQLHSERDPLAQKQWPREIFKYISMYFRDLIYVKNERWKGLHAELTNCLQGHVLCCGYDTASISLSPEGTPFCKRSLQLRQHNGTAFKRTGHIRK
jgi:hypothetical protein